jgi:hypothetical protein
MDAATDTKVELSEGYREIATDAEALPEVEVP